MSVIGWKLLLVAREGRVGWVRADGWMGGFAECGAVTQRKVKGLTSWHDLQVQGERYMAWHVMGFCRGICGAWCGVRAAGRVDGL